MNSAQRRKSRRLEEAHLGATEEQKTKNFFGKEGVMAANDAKKPSVSGTQGLSEAWYFYRSKYAGCAAFTFALFLVVAQINPTACNFDRFSFWGDTCPLRFSLFISLFSSLIWFILHIATTTYDQLGDISLAYLKKPPFKYIWGIFVVFAMLGSMLSIYFLVAKFSKPIAFAFIVAFVLGVMLITIHHLRVEIFIKSKVTNH